MEAIKINGEALTIDKYTTDLSKLRQQKDNCSKAINFINGLKKDLENVKGKLESSRDDFKKGGHSYGGIECHSQEFKECIQKLEVAITNAKSLISVLETIKNNKENSIHNIIHYEEYAIRSTEQIEKEKKSSAERIDWENEHFTSQELSRLHIEQTERGGRFLDNQTSDILNNSTNDKVVLKTNL